MPCSQTWDGGVALGVLCSDGSVCRDSDRGPVCWFVGGIPNGDACPAATCAAGTVCDCEPGTICHEGFCRQVCVLPPIEPRDAPTDEPLPDTGPREAAVCGPLATCTVGVCIPSPTP
jgi:hypothetical protein